jgi:tRNA 5-methylaminomethyl-2-thiouridine biosynthesis bifunctional protein
MVSNRQKPVKPKALDYRRALSYLKLTLMTTETPDAEPLSWQDKVLPISERYDDKYYSEDDGLMESQYVYLEQNSLVGRWKFAKSFSVGELGFGTGLNFLATWNLWKRTAYPQSKLHFVSVEKYPLDPKQIAHALSRWPHLSYFTNQLLEAYKKPTEGFHRFYFDDGRVVLTLLIGDAFDCLKNFEGNIDAWFLDGFAPKKNPEMWSEELFQLLAEHSNTNTTYSTFTCAGFVKRNLEAAGFSTEKFAGFGRKKEMLKGKFSIQKKSKPKSKANTALVIGGGISGTSVAHALSQRGFKIDLIEREKDIALKTSGNRMGIFTPVLSAEPHHLSKLSFIGYRYLLETLRKFQKIDWLNCGTLKLAINKEEETRLKRALKVVSGSEELMRWVDSKEASEIAGMPLEFPGIYFPEAGCISPRSLCQNLVAGDENITTHFSSDVVKLEKLNHSWRCYTSDGKTLEADILVLANAYDALQFEHTSWLPLRQVRGQAIHIHENELTKNLKTVLCYDGYMIPSVDGIHLVGATYDRDNPQDPIRDSDNIELLERLGNTLPKLDTNVIDIDSARVGIRTSTPGQTPIIGSAMNRHGKILSNLYLSLGHGSRGMTFAPLAGEIIASQICNEPIPLDSKLLYINSAERHWDRLKRQAS